MVNAMVLTSFFEALFTYDFIFYALIAGILVGALAPMIGSVVVIRRLSFIADTISHFSLAGVCLGVILSRLITFNNVSPVLMGVVFSVLGTFLIELLRNFYKNYKEISMPIVMSLGLALSGLLINISPYINSQYTTSLLYGSIYSVSLSSLIVILIASALIIIFATLFYKQILNLCFDETFAKISGLKVKLLQLSITIILSLVISLFLNVIGVLLISSLMILPIAAAILIGTSFFKTVSLSVLFSEISVIFGFIISYHTDLSTGPIIIIINLIIYVVIITIKTIRKRYFKKEKLVIED